MRVKKLISGNPPLRSKRGIYAVQHREHVTVVTKWPRKRNKIHPNQAEACDAWALISAMVKNVPPEEMTAAMELAAGTPFTWKDILFINFTQRLFIGQMQDGQILAPASMYMTAVQDLLNNIGTTQGAIIYRNATDWTLLVPGSDGQVLAYDGTGKAPKWEDVVSAADQLAALATAADGRVLIFDAATGEPIWLNLGAAVYDLGSGIAAPTDTQILAWDDASGSAIWVDKPAGGAAPVPLWTKYSSTGNTADTNEDTLATYSLPGGTLANDGDSLRLRAWGTKVTNTNSITIKFYIGINSWTLFTSTSGNDGFWELDAEMIRNGAAGGYLHWKCNRGTVGLAPTWTINQATVSNTWSGATTIKITGQNTTIGTANTVTCKGLVLEKLVKGTSNG